MEESSSPYKSLKERLEETEEKLMQAAEFGKLLLDENEALKDKIDEVRKECEEKMEEAEQERHTLLGKLEQKSSMEAWYNEEIGYLKHQLAEGNDNLRETLETEKNMELGRLNRKIEELKADLVHQCSIENQLKQKISELEDLVKDRLNQTDTEVASRSFGMSEEVGILQEENSALQNEVTSLQSQLIDKRTEIGASQTEIENLRMKLTARDEELEEIKCQFTSLNNSLEKAKEEKLDLKCQLDALQMENSCKRGKGNSIFSELDDRRVDAEKKIVTLQETNVSLTEKYQVEKQQNIKYKRQISQLMLMSSTRVNSEYVADLERKLSQARQETKALLEKEQEKQNSVSSSKLGVITEEVKASGDNFKQYMVSIIEKKQQEIERLERELQTKSLHALDLKHQRTQQESRIYNLESDVEKLRWQNVTLKAKMEELTEKYEPGTTQKSKALTVKRTEKIEVNDSHVTITEIRPRKVLFNEEVKENVIECQETIEKKPRVTVKHLSKPSEENECKTQ